MLNAMFKEFQELLGDEYGLFREFNPQPWRISEWREKYKNLGVLYVVNGNLNKLPDGAMMEITYALELFMRVDDTVNISDVVVLPLEQLATGTTGIIYSDNGQSSAQYILDTALPTSDGALIEGEDCNYIRYELSISVVFTNGVALTDNNNITLTIDDETYTLKSVLSFVEAPQTQLETSVFINGSTGTIAPDAMKNETMVVATGWNAQINKLFRPDQQVDVMLRELILDNPTQKITITYKSGNEDRTRTRAVILHDCVFTNELGQPQYLTINLSTAMRDL